MQAILSPSTEVFSFPATVVLCSAAARRYISMVVRSIIGIDMQTMRSIIPVRNTTSERAKWFISQARSRISISQALPFRKAASYRLAIRMLISFLLPLLPWARKAKVVLISAAPPMHTKNPLQPKLKRIRTWISP